MASVELQEKANFTRLSRLLVDKGTEALRNTFDTIHPSVSLPRVLAANKTSLLRLKPRVINNSQWDLLFPPSGNPPDSKTFDVTLLTVLFRNICGLPSTGWSVMPPDTDRSIQANIARIKFLRNEVYAHVTLTQVDNSKFENLWKKITQALVELNIPKCDIDYLETCPLGPEEEVYVKTLKDWKVQEDECITMLEGIGCSVNRLIQITDELRQSTFEQQNKMEVLQRSIVSDDDFLRKLAKHKFKSKIERKMKFFHTGTREWLLEKVNEWFHKNDNDSRMLLITVGPGFGKSVFAAKVSEDFKKNGKLAACHFCDFSNSNLRDPMMMLQSLASHMCENVPAFKEKILDQLKRPHQVQSLKDAFQIYLQNPFDELELDEPILVVIDGLDESAAEDKNEIMNLIADYFPDLPKYIKILATSRPEICVERLRNVQKINIANNDYDNNLDLELYFQTCLPSLVDRETSEIEPPVLETTEVYYKSLLSVIVEKCEGSFLYAYEVQCGLNARHDLEEMTSDEIVELLPEGLESIYQKYFKRLEDDLNALNLENLDMMKILEILAASKGPLPLSFVAQALGLTPDTREAKRAINRINEAVSCLIYVSDDMLSVFHKSVIDWLLAKGYKDHQYTVKFVDGNKSLWVECEKMFEEVKERVCSRHEFVLTNEVKYALNHGLDHLVESNMEEGVNWSVDVVILYFMLTLQENIKNYLKTWRRILQSSVVNSEVIRARISWHIVELDFLFCHLNVSAVSRFYLKAVLTRSPKGYFSDDEKKVAETLLSNVPQLIELRSYDVSVLPQAFWSSTYKADEDTITSVALSNDKKRIAVRVLYSIHVLSVPTLVEIMNYSTAMDRTSCCTFSPDDSLILFGKLEAALNIAEEKEVPFFPGNKEKFKSCAFSPNGKRLVTSDGSETIKLWDVANQRLLSLLCANHRVNRCSFSSTELLITAHYIYPFFEHFQTVRESKIKRSRCDAEVSRRTFCVWDATTLQRCDKQLEIGSDSGVNERIPYFTKGWLIKLTSLEDGLWLFADTEKVIIFKTLDFSQEQSLSHQLDLEVYSSSFSPEGSRLATCTSDGCINVWNVYTSNVEQRFESNHGGSSFTCWWSENFLFVFDLLDRIPRLTRYPVDENLEILWTHSQQVSLCHHEFENLTKVVDFSHGFLIFECKRWIKPKVKVLDVSGGEVAVMITLPGIEHSMKVKISPGGAFVFGGNKCGYYIWKRNTEEPALYEVFFRRDVSSRFENHYKCCFSNDSKIAVVSSSRQNRPTEIVDLDTGSCKKVEFNCSGKHLKLLLVKDKVVIAVFRHIIALLDMDSGSIIDCFLQRHLAKDTLLKAKLSAKENMLAFPDTKGNMVFHPLRTSIPPSFSQVELCKVCFCGCPIMTKIPHRGRGKPVGFRAIDSSSSYDSM